MTAGHKYLRIARELKIETVRAMINADSREHPDSVLPAGTRALDRNELLAEEAIKVSLEYHVFFFEGPLDSEQQHQFLDELAGFFLRLDTPLIKPNEKRLFQHSFDNQRNSAEFQALIPVGDLSWLESYVNTCRRFSSTVRKIVSFQGARFQ